MSILKVARLGHPVLRQVAEPIDPAEVTGDEIQVLIEDMLDTMYEYNGVGLAAPQVHVSKQLCLVAGETDEDDSPIVRPVINPIITPTTDVMYGMYEGCLSIPDMRGWVERPVAIHAEYLDGEGNKVERDIEGFPAIVFQHECDHLIGKLFVDRIKDMRKFAFEQEAERYLPVDRTIDGRDV